MKKIWIVALAALWVLGCADGDSQEQPGPDTPSTGSVCGDQQVTAGEKCDPPGSAVACAVFDSSKTWEAGGIAKCSADCKTIEINTCKEAAVTCESQGKVTCNGQCYDKCANGKPLQSDCTCPGDEPGQTCEDQGKVTCNGQCYDKCANGKPLQSDCTCPSDEPGQTCEDQGKVTCNGQCYDKCANGKDLQEDCTCPSDEPVTGPCQKNVDCTDNDKPVCIQGECKASECGDGVVYTPEVCDPALESSYSGRTCTDYDDTKQWKDGGKPGCANNCILSVGSCVEKDEVVSDSCGNGKLEENKGEECDPKKESSWSSKTCKELAGDKRYTSTSMVTCSATCKFDTSNCIEDLCGNGQVDALNNEKCDFGVDKGVVVTSKACVNIDSSKWGDGNAKCTNACKKLDTSNCIEKSETGKSGLYYCQLMGPTRVEFNDQLKEQTMTVRYEIGTDVTEANMKAELVWGADFKDVEFASWKTVAATQDKSGNKFTAKLTKDNVSAFGNAAFYTFRISKTGQASDWVYCKRNPASETDISKDNVEDQTLRPYIVSENDKLNAHIIGEATVSNVAVGDIIAKFTFDNVTQSKPTDPISADEGSGSFRGEGKNWTCPSGNCFKNHTGYGKAWKVDGWTKAKADAIDKGKRIWVYGLNTSGVETVALDFQVAKNNTSTAPTDILVRRSTDGQSFEEVRNIPLTASNEAYVDLSTEVSGNVPNLYIELVPYGNTGQLNFDNVVVKKVK
ncbi:MAG: hypothetical protein IJ165_05860 [Proteobacteria bacterium]|nr:hypothetical protein [Pseudomonadota bacterium]